MQKAPKFEIPRKARVGLKAGVDSNARTDGGSSEKLTGLSVSVTRIHNNGPTRTLKRVIPRHVHEPAQARPSFRRLGSSSLIWALSELSSPAELFARIGAFEPARASKLEAQDFDKFEQQFLQLVVTSVECVISTPRHMPPYDREFF